MLCIVEVALIVAAIIGWMKHHFSNHCDEVSSFTAKRGKGI